MQKLLPMHTLAKGFREILKGLVQLPIPSRHANEDIGLGSAGGWGEDS